MGVEGASVGASSCSKPRGPCDQTLDVRRSALLSGRFKAFDCNLDHSTISKNISLATIMSTSVLISTFSPFPTLSLPAPNDTTFADLYDLLAERYPALPRNDSENLDLVLSPHSGPIPPPEALLTDLLNDGDEELVTLRLIPRLRGGKGGFGSQLRAAGGRMSSQKTSNNDSCRDLSGRRLSTIKEAKRCVL